jgi:hypothetical protein
MTILYGGYMRLVGFVRVAYVADYGFKYLGKCLVRVMRKRIPAPFIGMSERQPGQRKPGQLKF